MKVSPPTITSHLAPSIKRWEKKAWKLLNARTMSTILAHALGLVYTLLSLMPSHYQRDSLQAILGLFVQAQGHPWEESLKKWRNVRTKQTIHLNKQIPEWTFRHFFVAKFQYRSNVKLNLPVRRSRFLNVYPWSTRRLIRGTRCNSKNNASPVFGILRAFGGI